MDGSAVFRLISLIPDRSARAQSGSLFEGTGSERIELLTRFLGWLGPLSPISKEEQQLLGIRGGGARPMAEDEGLEPDGLEPEELDAEEAPGRPADTGTRLAL
jgi:hypothetical protein